VFEPLAYALFVFGDREAESRREAEHLESLPDDALEKLPGPVARLGIAVEDGEEGDCSGRLEAADTSERIETTASKCSAGTAKGVLFTVAARSLPSSSGSCGGGDDDRSGAVDLAQKVVVYQGAAIFGHDQVGPAAWSRTDFDAAASDQLGDAEHSLFLGDLALFERCHPDFLHPFGGQERDVVIADHMALGQEFLASRPEDGCNRGSGGPISLTSQFVHAS